MEAPLKELERLQKLVSDEPSMGKSKTPAIQDSLNSLLQTLHVQKKRLEAGLATEAELTTLARTAEARKKEIDERQKEIYNSLARYGKALDKVRWLFVVWFRLGGFVELTGLRVGVEIYDAVADLRASFCFEGGPELFGTCHRYAFPQDGAILYGRDVCTGACFPRQCEGPYAQTRSVITRSLALIYRQNDSPSSWICIEYWSHYETRTLSLLWSTCLPSWSA